MSYSLESIGYIRSYNSDNFVTWKCGTCGRLYGDPHQVTCPRCSYEQGSHTPMDGDWPSGGLTRWCEAKKSCGTPCELRVAGSGGSRFCQKHLSMYNAGVNYMADLAQGLSSKVKHKLVTRKKRVLTL